MSDNQRPKYRVIDWNPAAQQGQDSAGDSRRNKIFGAIATVAVLVALAAIGLSWRTLQQHAAQTGPKITAEEQQELAYKNRGRAELGYETASQSLSAARALPVSHENLFQEIALVEKAFLLAESQLQSGKYAVAADGFESVIALTEEYTETVEMQRNANKRYDDLLSRVRAIERYKTFSLEAYDTAYSAIGEGRHLLDQGSFRAAWQAFDEASDTLADFETRKKAQVVDHLRAGNLALKAGDEQGAITAFEAALQYDGANEAGERGVRRAATIERVHQLLIEGKAAEEIADHDAAITAYEAAFELDEFSVVAQQGAARSRADQREIRFNGFVTAAVTATESATTAADWDEVIVNYEQALEVYPQRDDISERLDVAHEEHHASLVHHTLADAYDLERAFRWDDARNAYERLLDLEPDYEDAIEGLIRVGRTVRAKLEYEKLLELAEQHMMVSDYQAAIRAYNQAMSTKPGYLAISPEAAEMREVLDYNSQPIDITFASDTKTWVSITNFRMLGKIKEELVSLPPGDYEVIGRRNKYKDVMLLLKVRPQMTTNLVQVVCSTRADT